MAREQGRTKIRQTRSAKRPDTTTTLGTRLTDAEKSLLDEAARLKGWSSAQLLREAALEKARNLIEFSKRDIDCHQLAQTWAERIVHPRSRLLWNEDYLATFDSPHENSPELPHESSDFDFRALGFPSDFPIESATGVGATPDELTDLKGALEVCGGPLLDLVFRYAARLAPQATAEALPDNESRKASPGSGTQKPTDREPTTPLSDGESTSTK